MRRFATHTCIASIYLFLAACESKDVGSTAVTGHGTLGHETTVHETTEGTASSAPVTTSDGESAASAKSR